jgi:hypothetical protein
VEKLNKLLDFSNIKTLDYPTVLEFQKEHKIFFTQDGEQRGWEPSVFTKHSDNFFCLKDAPELFRYLPPSQFNERRMARALLKSRAEYRNFLNSAIAGNFDSEFVNVRLKEYNLREIFITENDFNFSFSIGFTPRNIEEFIDVHSIINLIFNGQGEQFARVRSCGYCGDYFIPGSLKGGFCKKKCYNQNYYQNRK